MVAPRATRIPGYRFTDGRLLVFEADRITLVRGWPEPEAAQKVGERAWQPLRPAFRLVRPYRRRAPRPEPARRQLMLPMEHPPRMPTRRELGDQKRRSFESFRFALPRSLARGIESFDTEQFAMIEMFAKDVHFGDLLGSNPALAFGLAQLGDAGLVSAPQAEIAARLGFDRSKATARALRKMPAQSVSRAALRHLRTALRDPDDAAWLAHLPRINAGVLALIGDRSLRSWLTPSLLEEVAASKDERHRARVAHVMGDVLALHRDLRGEQRPPVFRSIEVLRETQQVLGAEFAKHRERGILQLRFPRPPVPGNESIVPLTLPRDLIAEGARQRNCVASYAPAVADRRTFVYRVLAPERATLSLRRGSGGAWEVSELYLSCNQPVAPRTRRAVEAWLDCWLVSA